MQLTETEFSRAKQVFRSFDPLDVARYLAQLQVGKSGAEAAPELRDAAARLGWVTTSEGGLTEIGWFVADSCREYVFWRERDRKLPFADAVPDVISERLVGKDVLEIGSGSGMNLMSMAPMATRAVGLEPVGVYRQIGAILAGIERHANVDAVPGAAEALPFATDQFETVICVSAHQYFDLMPALREIARVLRPGGEAVLISGVLSSYTVGSARQISAGPGPARNYVVTVLNTVGYMFLRRRIVMRPSKWSTAYPIYPSRWAMVRMLRKAGLEMVEPPRFVSGEAMFRARKARRP